jgi:hypothetical protein
MAEFESPVCARNSDSLRFLRYGTAAAWISWLLSVGLLWVEHQLRILHPWSLLFIAALVITFGAAVIALVLGFWRVLRGPRHRAALVWSLSALFPVLFWLSLGLYAYRNDQRGYHPHNLPMILMTRLGYNLMHAQAVYLYPHRLESERLVMFYGDGVTDPEGDIQAMDRHVAHLEEISGSAVPACGVHHPPLRSAAHESYRSSRQGDQDLSPRARTVSDGELSSVGFHDSFSNCHA